ncbi:MAG: glycosyltransferase [Ignavibacteriota bacterium]
MKSSSSVQPLVRLLFLGDPRTDRRLKNFIGFFLENSFIVEVIYANPDHNAEDWYYNDNEGVTVTRLRLRATGGPKMFFEYERKLTFALSVGEPCDLLFACELYSLRSAATAKLAARAKFLLYDARELYTELPTVSANPLKKWFWKRKERQGLMLTDLIITTAPDDADAIKAVHGFLPPVIVVRNLPKSEALRRSSLLHTKFSITDSKRIFVYLGGLQKDRGISKMIEAISSITQRAAFVIIGEGVLKRELQELVGKLNLEGDVFFHPAIPTESAVELLSAADIGVSLIEQNSKSYALALPSKIFEYRLAGLPVVTSPLKQVRDIFENEKGIFFADPVDPIQILEASKAALTLSADDAERNAIHTHALNRHTFEKETELLRDFIRKMMGSVGEESV